MCPLFISMFKNSEVKLYDGVSLEAGQKFLLENVAEAFSKGVSQGPITKIYGLIISWGYSRMICYD